MEVTSGPFPMKILICEQCATTALDLWWLLHEQGHSICGIARSTSDCLEKVAQKQPELVMVDDGLQDGLTGGSLVETLAMSGFPAVIVSWEPHRVAAGSSARAVLQKPFTEAALASAMARVERREARRVAAE
jgi:CheY-like chemotaxis protein